MNCLNGERYLKKSLESIVNQSYKNWELIFWNNRSKDKSVSIFKKFKDKRFRYFLARKRTVLYKARNLAIKKSKGEFIAFLDVDDLWDKNKLSEQIIKFNNKKVGLVYSNFWKYNEFTKTREIAFKRILPEGKIAKHLIKDYTVGIITAVIRKKFLNTNYLFDYKYDLISDYDFILHYSLQHEFACVQKPMAYYRIHNEQLQKLQMAKQAFQFCKWIKNKKIFLKFKNYDLTNIKKKFEYFDLIKDLEKNKFKVIVKALFKLNLYNLFKILLIVTLPKKFIYKFVQNV